MEINAKPHNETERAETSYNHKSYRRAPVMVTRWWSSWTPNSCKTILDILDQSCRPADAGIPDFSSCSLRSYDFTSHPS
ncbi:hypothetical protein Y032_0466g1974 [Ancylostoma ceylanicum]|uniref:Uncharacterized protein n=1 Tax=Ancylostoma ceylanicum TaxID=53326 RepID=A0A016WXG9_9BILA|nr:hypothetical protein Y032_0466g1974 [Ancylostoma ceylanicum]